MRNAFTTSERSAGAVQRRGRFGGDFFLFQGGVGEGDGIEHGFEQADDGGELRRRKPVDQFVGVLFGVGHEFSCPSIFTQRV